MSGEKPRISSVARKFLNNQLFELNKTLYDAVPLNKINAILAKVGFRMEEMILCGREGRATVNLHPLVNESAVVENSMLVLSWYKHDTGRYEINSYMS